MSDQQPAITSLVVRNEPPEDDRLETTPPWHKPFLELLELLTIVDNSKPVPKVEDQRLCFQPSPDFSEISKVFLSVSTPDFQYDVDLNTISTAGSEDVPQAVDLQIYASKVLRRNREFRDRLLQRNLITNLDCSPDADLFTCPICFDPLLSCFECDAEVTCSSDTCLGSLVSACEQCSMHERMVCVDCLKSNKTVTPLIYCTVCDTWCCREDAYWCAGLVVEPDSGMIVRSHLPRHGPCKYCADDDLPLDWASCRSGANDTESDRCSSQTPFMTQHGLRAAHCPTCLEVNPGRGCVCGLNWLCEMCFAAGVDPEEQPYLVACPRCGLHYCTAPARSCAGSIDYCTTCKRATLCTDCQAEDPLPVSTQANQSYPRPVVLTERCGSCDALSCQDCSTSSGTVRCFHCSQWQCRKCVAEPERGALLLACPVCCRQVCHQCRLNGRACFTIPDWTKLP